MEERADRGRDLPLDHLAAALDELADVVDDDSLANWNDKAWRTQRDVINVLELAGSSAASKLDNDS